MIKIDESIFKAYDIRGTYPDQLDEEVAYKIGRALVEYLKPTKIAVGRDMRLSSPDLCEALISGIVESEAEVVDIGLVSTDCLYFAVGKYGYDAGVMITASHNPPQYNGFKLCKKEAVPLSGESGIDQIKNLVVENKFSVPLKIGRIERIDLDDAFVNHLLSFVDQRKIKPFKIVMDAGNGMAGKIIPKLFSNLSCRVVPMFFELDGSFPNHLASPIEPQNIAPLRERVLKENADLGAAFDGDADRVFLVDEKANPLGGGYGDSPGGEKSSEKRKRGDHSLQFNLLQSRSGSDRKRGRKADSHPGGACADKTFDERIQRGLRGRALRTLLFP